MVKNINDIMAEAEKISAEESIGILMAISIVAKKLAEKLSEADNKEANSDACNN